MPDEWEMSNPKTPYYCLVPIISKTRVHSQFCFLGVVNIQVRRLKVIGEQHTQKM